MPSAPPDFPKGMKFSALRGAVKGLRDWCVRTRIRAATGSGIVLTETRTGTSISVDPAVVGGVSYARVGPAGIGAGVAGYATLLAPDGTDRYDITLTNGWSGALDPGTKVFVGRDFLTNGWIVGPYECSGA